MAKKKTRKIQRSMIFIGSIMVVISYLIFVWMSGGFSLKEFIFSLQPEFGSVGLVVLLVGGIWLLTKMKINT